MNLMYTYGTATFALGGTSGGAWVTQHNTPNIGIFAKITRLLGFSVWNSSSGKAACQPACWSASSHSSQWSARAAKSAAPCRDAPLASRASANFIARPRGHTASVARGGCGPSEKRRADVVDWAIALQTQVGRDLWQVFARHLDALVQSLQPPSSSAR